jgi:adenylate cyclase
LLPGCDSLVEGGAVTSDESPGRDNEEFWRDFLSRGHSKERAGRRVFKLIPHDPRCRLCAAPFGGVGSPLMRLIGKRPSDKNPNWCASCFSFMSRNHGGAEIEVTMLFADVRGSTTLAESMPSADFRRLMDRFYDTAATVVFDHDGIVDKFVGDELVAMFFPLLTGERHAARAVDAARSSKPPATPIPMVPGFRSARACTPAWPGSELRARGPTQS